MGILYLISYVLDILGEYLSARLKVMQQNILEKKQALFTAARYNLFLSQLSVCFI